MSELFDPLKSLEKHLGEFDFNSRIPLYNDSSDYTTNAPSYYDDLARKNKLIKHLSLRIWDYDKELAKRFDEWDKNIENMPEDLKRMLEDWMEDGTLDEIINQNIFNNLNQRLDNDDDFAYNLNDFKDKVVNGDWTPAINHVINLLPDTGGRIHLPKTINIKSPLNVNKAITFVGTGNGTNKLPEDRGKTVIIKDGNFNGITLYTNSCKMINIQVDGADGNTGDGIVIAGSRQVLRDVSVMNQGRDGIRIGTEESHNVNLWRIENVVSIYNGRHGMFIHDGNIVHANANAGTLQGLDTRGNSGDGLIVQNAMDNSFFGVSAQSNAGKGIRLRKPSRGNYFYRPYFELNGDDYNEEVLIEDGARRNVIDGQPSVMAYRAIRNNGDKSNQVNYISVRFPDHPYYHESPVGFSKVIIGNDNPDDVPGFWELNENSDGDLDIKISGTSTSGKRQVNFKTSTSGDFQVNLPKVSLKDILFENRVMLKHIDARTNTINLGTIAPHYSKDFIYSFDNVIPGDIITCDIIEKSNEFPPGLVLNVFINSPGSITLRVSNITQNEITGGSPIMKFINQRIIR